MVWLVDADAAGDLDPDARGVDAAGRSGPADSSGKVSPMPADPGSPPSGPRRTVIGRHDLVAAPLADLQAAAAAVRDEAHGTRMTFSPKVFIPLTMLCRDRCGYCTFAKAPARLASPYLSLDEVLAIARAGRAAGCHEALFTLGEAPEDRYPAAAGLAGRPRLRLHRRLPGGGLRRPCSRRPGCSPTPTPGP